MRIFIQRPVRFGSCRFEFCQFLQQVELFVRYKEKKIFNHIASLFATRYTLYSNNEC